MKRKTIFTISFVALIFMGTFLLVSRADANGGEPYQMIDLEPGWSIVSTPKVLSSHEFSVSETSANLDIYLLSPDSISGWKTMQEASQAEFQPLSAYFINNKTGQVQALKLYYNYDLSPSQRLFNRSLNKGWNTIGIANPEYALIRGTDNTDTNNPSKILYSTLNCISDIIDFTADQSSLDSVRVGSVWTNKIATEIDNLNDFRELKAYGVYVTADDCPYNGSQNINDSFVFSLSDNNPTQLSSPSNNQDLFIFEIDSLYDLNIVSLDFSHSGTGNRDNISNFKLYDVDSGELLGSLVDIDSDDNLIFQNLNIDINSGTKKIKLVGDIGSSDANEETHNFSLDIAGLDQDITITGLPINNEFVVSSVYLPGDLILSLASDNPEATTLPRNVQGVTFLKINIAGSGTINQITVKRKGAGSVADFGDLYIYENGVRLTPGRSLSPSTNEVTFINLSLQGPTTFEIVADLYTATTGNVNYFSIESVSDVIADATIGGIFPLNGNVMGISGTNAGTITVTRSGASATNVTIGAVETEISQFKVTTATEGTYVERVRLFNGGTVDNDKITNLKLKNDIGTTLATATSITLDGYIDFFLSSPYHIERGGNDIFRVFADIGAVKSDTTIRLYLELSTDILATGSTYGYGMLATITSYNNSSHVTVTCKRGVDLIINKVGPVATKISTTTADTNFLEFTMSAVADITIKRTRLVFCIDTDGNGTYNAASTSAGADIEDIKIKDKDSGVIIVGPKDGTAFNDGTTASCPGGVNGVYEDFTETIDLAAGITKTYQITADIKTSNTDSGVVISNTDKIKFILYSYATLVGTSGDVNYMKYVDTGDAVDDSSIFPSTDISGEEMTVEDSSLTIAAASDTPDKSIAVMGTNDNEISKFRITSTNEAFYIEKFSIVLDDGQGIDSANRDNFSAVKIKYQTEAQAGTSNWTITSGKTFGSTASLAFNFIGTDRIYVPKDDSTYVTALVSIADYNAGNGAKSKVPFRIYPISGSTSSFKAYGAQSGVQIITFTDPTSTDYNLHYVTRSKPIFAKEAWSGGELEMARFSITAAGYDVIFDGTAGTENDIASACLGFDFIASSTDDATGSLALYDWNENIVASSGTITWGSGITSVSFVFEERDITIPAGTTKVFHIDMSGADIADFSCTDEYIYSQLRNDNGGDLATGSMGFGQRNIVYHDGTNGEGISGQGDPELRLGMPALIKNIGPLPINFRTLRGTGSGSCQ